MATTSLRTARVLVDKKSKDSRAIFNLHMHNCKTCGAIPAPAGLQTNVWPVMFYGCELGQRLAAEAFQQFIRLNPNMDVPREVAARIVAALLRRTSQ